MDDHPADLDRWIAIAAASGAPDTAVEAPPVPREGTKAWRALGEDVVAFLVSGAWVAGEAAERGITVSDGAVRSRLASTREQAFADPDEYKAYLRRSRMTEEDLLFMVRNDLLTERLQAVATRGARPPTRAERLAYYRARRGSFATPSRRDVRIVLTRSRARAIAALAARRAGRSWASVARTYSIDAATREQGGARRFVARGALEKRLGDAVFTAARGVLTGPVRTEFGYHVFEVMRIRPARPPSFARAEATIRRVLIARREKAARKRFVSDYERRWRARTACALPGGLTGPDACSNPGPTG